MSYVTKNRALVQAVKEAALRQGIDYALFSDDWIIRLEKDGVKRFIFAYGFDCNSQASSNIAADKVATFQLLEDAALPVIPHHLLKSIGMPKSDARLLERLIDTYESVVVKPLRGSRGENLGRFEHVEDALRFMERTDEMWACAPYIEIEREIRVVVFDGVVQLAYEKLEPRTIGGLKMFNLNLGAVPGTLPVDGLSGDVEKLAINSMRAVGLTLGAVDIIIDSAKQVQVLEVNSGFSLEHYALAGTANRRRVIAFYERVVRSMFRAAS